MVWVRVDMRCVKIRPKIEVRVRGHSGDTKENLARIPIGQHLLNYIGWERAECWSIRLLGDPRRLDGECTSIARCYWITSLDEALVAQRQVSPGIKQLRVRREVGAKFILHNRIFVDIF